MSKYSLLDAADVRWDKTKDRPTSIRGEFPLPATDSPEDAIINFLSDHADELRLPVAEESLETVQAVDTPSGQTYRFVQKLDEVPVFGTEVMVVIDRDRRVKQIDLSQEPHTDVAQPAGDTKLKPRAALKSASDFLGDYTQRDKPATPEAIYFPSGEGLKLAFKVLIPTREPAHDWLVIVDAYSGDILHHEDLIVHIPDGQGLVFDPNPVVTAGNNALRDPDATAASCGFAGTARATVDGQRVTRTLSDIRLDGTVHRLEGPYVRIRDFGAPSTIFPAEANAGNFNYSSGDERFEAVNVYYHIDTFQRYLQSIGITSAHNRVIECDPHEGSGAAFFSPVDGGLHFSNSGPCRPDRAEDGHVMIHEYGHAIQNNMVPTWGGTNPTTGRQETRAMGEGFGDTMACVFYSDHGGGFLREVFEQWIFGDQGGLRRVDGTKIYPTDWVSQVHSDGEIWSAALWSIYRAIGGDSMIPAVRVGARRALIKSVVLSHFRIAGNATMPQGAEAVMLENEALEEYLGKQLMAMLDSFHNRGLLVCDPNADLYIRDAAGDPGIDAFTGAAFWNSPDLWIRNSDDGLSTHQAPEFGQDNYFYARVTNRGSAIARAFVVTFNVKPWAGTEFVYPNDFLPPISAAVGFNLAPGASTVVKAKWPQAAVPAAGTHACWLASIYTPTDVSPAGRHVWEHNNLAQKNLTVVDLAPNDSVLIPFQLGSLFRLKPERFRIEVRRPNEWRTLPVAMEHKEPEVLRKLLSSIVEVPLAQPVRSTPSPIVRFLEPSRVEIAHPGLAADPVRLNLGRDSTVDLGPAEGPAPRVVRLNGREAFSLAGVEASLVTSLEGAGAIAFNPGQLTGFPVVLEPRSPVTLDFKLTVPPEAKPGDVIEVDLLQRSEAGDVVGGITVQINVVEP